MEVISAAGRNGDLVGSWLDEAGFCSGLLGTVESDPVADDLLGCMDCILGVAPVDARCDCSAWVCGRLCGCL